MKNKSIKMNQNIYRIIKNKNNYKLRNIVIYYSKINKSNKCLVFKKNKVYKIYKISKKYSSFNNNKNKVNKI